MSCDLLAFLTDRLAEDEELAKGATPGPWWHNPVKLWMGAEAFERYDRTQGEEFVGYGGPHPFTGCIAATGPADNPQSMRDADHIARHDPARVLADVAAKRRILARHSAAPGDEGLAAPPCCAAHPYEHHDGAVSYPVRLDDCPDLRDLALPHAGHPAYKEAWRP